MPLEDIPRVRIAGALEFIRHKEPLRFIREGRNRLILWADIRKCLGLSEKRPEDYSLKRGTDFTTRVLNGYHSRNPLALVVREGCLQRLKRCAKREKNDREIELLVWRQYRGEDGDGGDDGGDDGIEEEDIEDEDDQD